MPYVSLHSVPTTNTIDIVVSLWQGRTKRISLAPGAAAVCDFAFDTIKVGGGSDPAVFELVGAHNYAAHPGNVAFVQRGDVGEMQLHFGQPNTTGTTVVFRRP